MEPFQPVKVGTSPAGVEWVAYAPEHVQTMKTRLARLWSMRKRTVKLTPAQHYVVGDILAVFRDSGAQLAGLELKNSSVTATQSVLDDIAARVESEISSIREIGVDINGRWSEAKENFAIASRVRSLNQLRKRLTR